MSIVSSAVQVVYFFFSSRRRHTRCLSDWSSDVCSSDLQSAQDQSRAGTGQASQEVAGQAAAILAAQLGNKIGIPDISVESDLSNETSLVLGKYLSPRLYLSYGISLTESINTVKMRYTLDDRWTIKTEAGKERSADLVYTIEK